MAFRATSDVPAHALTEVKSQARALDSFVTGMSSAITSSGIKGDQLMGVWHRLVMFRDVFDRLKATPGLADYAASQENDATYDIAAEFTAMLDSINACISWIDTNVPRDASGYLLLAKSNADGTLSWRQFSSPATDGLVTRLNAIASAVA